MKNVLFATTALVGLGFAGAALADNPAIELSGSAELGVTYTDLDGAANDGIDLVGDIGIDITASGTSDSGLTFGANVEVEHTGANAGSGEDIDDFSVFVSGGFGTLTLGDVDSAYDKVSVGIKTGGLDDEADYYYSDAAGDGVNDGIILRYDYAFNAVTLSLSVEQGVTFDADSTLALYGIEAAAAGDLTDVVADDILSAGIGYAGSFGATDLSFGLGYQMHDIGGTGVDIIGVSARAGFGAFGMNASYDTADIDGVADSVDQIGVSVDYTAGPLMVGANYVMVDGGAAGESDSYGLFGEYDLGGGLSAVAAISNSDRSGDDELRAGFGFAMSF